MAQQTIGEMTREELKSLIRQVMQEVLWEIEQHPGLEDDLPIRPEIAAYLEKPLEEKAPFYTVDEVKKKLGLDG